MHKNYEIYLPVPHQYGWRPLEMKPVAKFKEKNQSEKSTGKMENIHHCDS